MIRWRDATQGEGAHYMCQWADTEGGWWESDGLVRAGAVRQVPAPMGPVTAQEGWFFPVIMIYETGV